MTGHPALVDGSFKHLRLGRSPARRDPRTLELANYIDVSALPPIPSAQDWSGAVSSWPMYGNDELGDCTVAALGHMIECWSYNSGTPKMPTVSVIERAYWETGDPSRATGRPGGLTDTGRVELDVLNYWRKTGVNRDRILAYASVNPRNAALVRAAVYLFGGVYIGLGLPVTAQTQHVWSVVGDGRTGSSAPGSWGGHAVNVVGYDANGLKLVTWGAPLEMTWGFNGAYTEEMYAIIDPDWYGRKGQTPSGFNEAQLLADLKQVGTTA